MRSFQSLLLAALLLAVTGLEAGCNKKTAKKDDKGSAQTAQQQQPQQQQQPPAQTNQKPILPDTTLGGGGGGGAAMAVRRGAERQVNQNELRQLALFFNQMKQQATGPVTKEDLKAYIERDAPKMWKLINEGVIIVNYNAELNSTSLLAYEQKADLNGNHLTVMGDASTKLTPSAQLQQMLGGR